MTARNASAVSTIEIANEIRWLRGPSWTRLRRTTSVAVRAPCSFVMTGSPHHSHQIDNRENEHPDQVDKVPIQADDIHLRRRDDVEPLDHYLSDDQGNPDDAEQDVGAVEPDQRVERGTEGAGREGVPFVHVM